MYGNATLEIPSDNTPEVCIEGLSDQLAMSYGMIFAHTLSDEHQYIVVTLSDGKVKVIGCDTLTGDIHIGRLVGRL